MLYRNAVRLAAVAAAMVLAGCADATAIDPQVPQIPQVVPVATVAVSPTPITLAVGTTAALTATPKSAVGAELSGRAVSWSSTDESVAFVAPTGLVTARAAGTATIRATSEGRTGTATIEVLAPVPAPPVVTLVDLDVATLTLDEGAQRVLVATPRDANGAAIPGLGMTWTSSDPTVALVDAVGKVTAVRAGVTDITVRVHGKSATATVAVTAEYNFTLMYSDNLEGGWSPELFTLELRQGAAPTRLLPGTTVGEARLSPDGSKVAFLGIVEGIQGIYVMNRDGSNIFRLVSRTDGPLVWPTWSPDGSKIAYQGGNSVSAFDIYVVNADGTNKVNLTADLGVTDQLTPSWSPAINGGSRIAFVHRAGGNENVWTMRPDGTDRRQITTGVLDEHPSWSPNGATIVFSRTNIVVHGDLHLVDANGQNVRPVMPFVSLAGPQWYPVFSPDGRMIAFSSQHETWSSSGEFQVYTIWTDGSKLAKRTTTGGMWPAFVPR